MPLVDQSSIKNIMEERAVISFLMKFLKKNTKKKLQSFSRAIINQKKLFGNL